MKVGLVGYPSVGKSTLYRAAAQGQAKGDMTAVPVPDPRFDKIVAQVKPKKVTPATVLFHDQIEDVQTSGKAFSQRFLDTARKMDLLLLVLRAFDSPVAPYHTEIDAERDRSAIEIELILTDLQIVENRLERLTKSLTAKNPGSPDYMEKALFEKIKGPLEAGEPIRKIELDEAEQTIVKNYQFLSAKPLVAVFNVDESAAGSPPAAIVAACEKARSSGTPAFAVCATIEDEISQLDDADQPEFLAAMGLSEPASHRMIQAIYESMGLITFFTAGDNDTRAWPLQKGSSALKAAATIHNDIAKGFIRAEIVHYSDWEEAGSLDAAYSANKMKLEGKEYVIQDGDLLHIRNKA